MTFREQTAQLLLAHALGALIAKGGVTRSPTDTAIATMVVSLTDALNSALAQGSRK